MLGLSDFDYIKYKEFDIYFMFNSELKIVPKGYLDDRRALVDFC